MGGILPKRRPPLQDGLALNDLKKTLKNDPPVACE